MRPATYAWLSVLLMGMGIGWLAGASIFAWNSAAVPAVLVGAVLGIGSGVCLWKATPPVTP